MAQQGGHRKAGHAARPLARLLGYAGIVVAGALGWWLLVEAAIDFGRSAKAGHDLDWVLLIVASVGAVLSLLASFWFVWRMLVLIGVLSDYQPKRASRRRRHGPAPGVLGVLGVLAGQARGTGPGGPGFGRMTAMPLPRLLAPAGYAALAAVDTVLSASPSPSRRRFRMITKPLLMPALGTAFSTSLTDRGINGGGLLRGGTVAAQALSGTGDIALLGTSERAFLTGVGAFAGAHVAYTTAFASAGRPLSDRRQLGGVLGAASVFAALGPALGWAAGRKSPALRLPVVGYAGILSTMFAASTRLDPTIPASARRKVVAGSGIFMLSDLTLAVREFLMEDPHPFSDAAVMATYTVGQGLIAAGVSEAIRSREGA